VLSLLIYYLAYRAFSRLRHKGVLLKAHLKPKIEERMVRAFLDVVILRMLLNYPMTGYEIEGCILKKFKVKISTNVVYTKLSSMEREALVKCTQNGHSRIYEVTANGNDVTDNRSEILKGIQKTAISVL
jgi:DNA-binding PadR family transcriptional regulator